MRTWDWSGVGASDRGTGRTSAMVEAVRKIKGVLVVRDRNEVARLEREFGIRATSLYRADEARGGRPGPVMFDPDAVGRICDAYERVIFDMGTELERLKTDLSNAILAMSKKRARRKRTKR